MTEHLTICDVGPRDGLQNQPTPIATEDKCRLISQLYGAGVRCIEATSFVSPKAVPQMADAAEVMRSSASYVDLRALALVLNEQGYHRARAAGAKAISVVVVCSETLAMKNSRRRSRDTIATARALVELAKQDNVYTRVCLAAAWHCPYDGATDPGKVLDYADEVWRLGIDELSVADTIGHAHPFEVRALSRKLVDACGAPHISVHLHDTQGMGLANAFAAMDAGVRILDASSGGLGGCPFAVGAAGNLATEDLVWMAHKAGFETGIDLDRLWRAIHTSEAMIGRPAGGRSKAFWLSQEAKNAHDAEKACV